MTRRIRQGLVGTGAGVAALAAHDLWQKKHSVLRNYPVVGHLRYLLEELRPELQEMEGDLHEHIHKENNILFPGVLEMEARINGS